MKKEKEIMSGQRITQLRCLSSFWDDGHLLWAYDDKGNRYRISTQDLLPLLNGADFYITQGKVHRHLKFHKLCVNLSEGKDKK
jgi:hypothetical protein